MNAPSSNSRLAAIDMGTNSFHLVTAEVRPNGKFTVLGRDKEVVRLGEGVTDMKHLSAEAIDRAIGVLQRFSMLAKRHAAPIRAVATSAVREAKNREDFVERVRTATGIDVEVVSGFEEARLIYLGVLQALPVYHRKILLVDIGGGSTEFLLGSSGNVLYANSLKIGAVRLTRRFFQEKTLKQRNVLECREFLAGELHPIRRLVRREGFEMVVGSSGTILSASAMILASLGLPAQADQGGDVIMKKDLEKVIAHVLRKPTALDRRSIPGLDPGRADIIVAGLLILEQIFGQLGIKSMHTSKYALREGIILDTIHKRAGNGLTVPHLRNIRASSVMHLGESCRYEKGHATTVTRLALELFDSTRALHKLHNPEREYLEAAAMLHDIGYHISHAQHHRHSYYIIRNAELLGFTEQEKEIIANVARYHRKSHPKDKHDTYMALSPKHRELVRKLAAILRIADGLDRRHMSVFRTASCRRKAGRMTIDLHASRATDCSLELWGAARRKSLFESVFGLPVEFNVLHE